MNGPKVRPLTPKEFSEAIGGVLSPATVRDYCRRGRLPTANGRRPYLIRPDALVPYRPDLARFLVS